MVNANNAANTMFSIRFQRVTDIFEPRTADIVVGEDQKKEFFDLVSRFGLEAIYTANDVWHVKPGEDTDVEALNAHESAWDIMFHKYLALGNEFKHRNAEYHRKKALSCRPNIHILLDTSGSMA